MSEKQENQSAFQVSFDDPQNPQVAQFTMHLTTFRDMEIDNGTGWAMLHGLIQKERIKLLNLLMSQVKEAQGPGLLKPGEPLKVY